MPHSDDISKKTTQAKKILTLLKKHYPDATTSLNHSNPLELLVATILSAQCTDERVNIVTRDLFTRYSSAHDYAHTPQDTLEEHIRPTGFYKNKAKAIRQACDIIDTRHGGNVPNTMDELLELPGVARKTANCVLSMGYGKNEGIVVDTHVGRITERLGLLTSAKNNKDAVRIERDLMELFPQKDWMFVSHALIDHGRAVCKARKPLCTACPLVKHCVYGQKNNI